MKLLKKAPAYPANHGYGLAVSDRLVAGGCPAVLGRGHGGIVGDALKAVALAGR